MNSIEELNPNGIDKILCVKVGKYQRENFYEMARKYWKVSLSRVSKATHVLAISEGIVKAVYIPKEWKLTEDLKHLGRYEFTGTEDFDSDYLGKSVKHFYGKSQNPIRYINM